MSIEKKGIVIITDDGEKWSSLPWYYGASYDFFTYPRFRIVWLPIPINIIVNLLRNMFRWLKSAGGQWSLIDRERSHAFQRGREYERGLKIVSLGEHKATNRVRLSNDKIRSNVESIVGSVCDGTFRGLEHANFVECGDITPQDLANKLIAYIESLLKEQT